MKKHKVKILTLFLLGVLYLGLPTVCGYHGVKYQGWTAIYPDGLAWGFYRIGWESGIGVDNVKEWENGGAGGMKPRRSVSGAVSE